VEHATQITFASILRPFPTAVVSNGLERSIVLRVFDCQGRNGGEHGYENVRL